MIPPPEQVLALSFVLFAIGVVGALARRNVIVMLLSAELMLNAAMLALVAFGAFHGRLLGAPFSGVGAGFGGESFGIIVAPIAVAEIAVALGVVAAWLRRRDSLDVDDLRSLKW